MRLIAIALPLCAVLAACIPVEVQRNRDGALAYRLEKGIAVLAPGADRPKRFEIALKGEEKSRKQNRCYYGDDGQLHKMPLGDTSEGKSPRGIRGKVAKKKKGEIKDYAEEAIALIKQYVPPEPQRIQKAKDAGKTSMTVYGEGSRLRLEVPDYLKPGDVLHIDIDPNGDRITGLSVATYLEADPKDAVTLDVKFSSLNDGTGYPASVVLDGQSQQLNITIENSGYRKTGA